MPVIGTLYTLMFHKLVSIVLTFFFGSIFLGISDYFVGYQHAMAIDYDFYTYRAGRGFGYVYITAVSAVVLLFMPNYFVAKYNVWSPTSVGKLFPRGFFLSLGYISALLTFALLYMFE